MLHRRPPPRDGTGPKRGVVPASSILHWPGREPQTPSRGRAGWRCHPHQSTLRKKARCPTGSPLPHSCEQCRPRPTGGRRVCAFWCRTPPKSRRRGTGLRPNPKPYLQAVKPVRFRGRATNLWGSALARGCASRSLHHQNRGKQPCRRVGQGPGTHPSSARLGGK